MTDVPGVGPGGRCTGCGSEHAELPTAMHIPAPVFWSPEMATDEASELTSDLCVIHGEHFFVHALIEIPVVGHDTIFAWGAWASLSADSFRRTVDDWDRPGREDAPPMFGWLSVELPGYAESTVNLKTMVHTRAVGVRPWLELEPTDHPLAVEQRAGISWETYVERVAPRA
jgi:hypothetical protein